MFPHQQLPLQIAYPPPLPQITYPMQNTQVQQPKVEPNQPPQGHLPEPPQLNHNFPTHGTIHAIMGGSSSEFENKRQRRDYYRQVNHIVVEGSVVKTKWSHMPITFSAADVKLTCFPHKDAMVINAHMDKWDVSKVLIDNGSQAKNPVFVKLRQNGLRQKAAERHCQSSVRFRRKTDRASGNHNHTSFVWELGQHKNRVHHLRCDRYVLPV